ncbi:MAG: vitamin B12 dependent methionine synthase [Deltaproteobacteria bacterium]|nr:vitamin B12 dependent methionine synthase [Deltaproteobacteria bacterium]
MEQVIVDRIPFHVNMELLMKRVRIKENSSHANTLKGLVEEAQTIANPKAMYRPVFIDSQDDERLVLDGVILTSRVLKVNLENAYRVFPFVATCGMELEDWAKAKDDMLIRFWAERIKEMALHSAIATLNKYVAEEFSLEKKSVMTPGSLKDWPIEEQKSLFRIVGNTEEAIGVQLTESLMMKPVHSVSGIIFPTEVSFESCQLCQRENCPGRRAPYDKDLYNRKYRKK